jgi:hypothetical protein
MHPLGSDLSKLSDDELQSRISELNRKRIASYQFGNADLLRQVDMLLYDCQQELMDRNARMLKKMEDRRARGEMDKTDKLINVSKK